MGLPVYEREFDAPAHDVGLRCREWFAEALPHPGRWDVCSLRANPQAAAQVAMASAMIQACLVFALCAALASTCQGAMVYGSTLRESPYIGLGGNLSDVARLQKDQVCNVLAILSAL